MSCQFLHKLAPELREKIYQYALDFCDTPLRNVGLLQPFVKNFTGAQGRLRLGYEDPMGGDSVITRVAFDEPLFDSPSIDTAILCTCKRIYREAIKVFYDLNTISVSVEVFNLIGINTPLGTELSLAKSLAITIRCESSFNTLDLDIFFQQIQSMSPNLKSVHIYTDGTSLPCTSLFDIGQDLSTSPYVQTVRFVSVGHLIATSTATPGLEIHVKYKILSDQWQAFDNMSQEALSAHAAKVFARPDNASTDHIYHLYGRWRSMDLSFVQELVEWEGERFWTDMPRVCPAFAQGGLWSWELWTWLAVPYGRRDQAFDFGEAAE